MGDIRDAFLRRGVAKEVTYKGEDVDEAAAHRSSLWRSIPTGAAIFSLIAAWGPAFVTPDPSVVAQGSPTRLAFYLCVCALMGRVLIAEFLQLPFGKGNRMEICRRLGFHSYLTCQTQAALSSLFVLSLLGEAALLLKSVRPVPGWVFASLVAGPHRLSIFVDGLGMVVTMLFFVLLWSSKSWQEKCRKPMERQGVPYSSFSAWSHAPLLPLGLADLMVRRTVLLHAHMPSLAELCMWSAVYTVFFTSLLFAAKIFTGYYQYMLCEDLTMRTWPGLIIGVFGGIQILLTGLVCLTWLG